MKIKNWLGPLLLSLSASIWGGMFVVVKIVWSMFHQSN